MTPNNPLLVAAGVKDPDKWINAVIETCAEFEINTPQRVAAFLAQTSHESGGYTMLSENLNYKAARLPHVGLTVLPYLAPIKSLRRMRRERTSRPQWLTA